MALGALGRPRPRPLLMLLPLLVLGPAPRARAANGDTALPEEDESRIIGGQPCSVAQRPFQVALTRRGQILCGGSLVGARWVLTAAHCRQPPRDLQVLIGTTSLRAGTGQVRGVQGLQVHPRYDPRRNDNDFMLLHLDAPVQFGPRVKRIRLAARCPRAGQNCSVSGWGTTKSPGGTCAHLGTGVPQVSSGRPELQRQRLGHHQVTWRYLATGEPQVRFVELFMEAR
ncbi:kallikrein-14-like [Taeniopygia guttata]|uniref:kallikrein-14-like n=1 Tax=Taeniopygia guttata TaxID=59729 RepID=UPI003BB9250C